MAHPASGVVRSLNITRENAMPASAANKKLKMFYATVHVTRTEQWCVEAGSAEEARERLLSGDGHRCDSGECLHAEVVDVDA